MFGLLARSLYEFHRLLLSVYVLFLFGRLASFFSRVLLVVFCRFFLCDVFFFFVFIDPATSELYALPRNLALFIKPPARED